MEENQIYDPSKAHQAQSALCQKIIAPHFAPSDGRCYRCRKNIYVQELKASGKSTGYTVAFAGENLITGCPHCNYSFCN